MLRRSQGHIGSALGKRLAWFLAVHGSLEVKTLMNVVVLRGGKNPPCARVGDSISGNCSASEGEGRRRSELGWIRSSLTFHGATEAL
jgi:hypothetical protein